MRFSGHKEYCTATLCPYLELLTINRWDNITNNVHSIIFWPFGLYGRYEGLKTYKQVLNWISVQEITIPNIKMYIGWY